MRRIFGWLLGASGVVLLIVGGVVAGYVGPSDQVRLPDRAVPDGTPVTVLGWRLLGYRDTTVAVTATASDGSVFLGAAHPVDLASYLGDRPFLEVRQISPTGALTGSTVGTGAVAAPTDPAAAGFWSTSVSGAGEQRLDVPLTGDPVSVAVLAPAGSSVSIGLGVVVSGLFRAALVVAAVGLLLLVLSVVLARRARRTRRAPRADAEGVEARNDPAAPREAISTTADSGRASRIVRTGSATGMLVLGLSLSGCVALPPSVAEPSGGVTKLALSPDQLPEVLQDYSARNDAVIADMAKGADEKAWAAVDAGTVLFTDEVDTALKRAMGKTSEVTDSGWKRTGTTLYSPRFAAYPLWAVVQSTWSREGADPAKSIAVYQRASVGEPWKKASDGSQVGDLPPPLSDGDPSASAADHSAGADLMAKTAAYLTKGTDPGFATQDVLTKARTDNLIYGPYKANLDCRPMVIAQRPEDSVRVVRTAGGRLVTIVLRCEQSIYSPDGQTVSWKPEFAKAYETTTDERPTVTRVLSATFTLHQGTDGAVSVVSQRVDDMRARDADWAQ